MSVRSMAMSEPDLSTLPHRMRYGAAYAWKPDALEIEAEGWERRDLAAGELEATIETLAREMLDTRKCVSSVPTSPTWGDLREVYVRMARMLAEWGWRKAGSDD
jgi:hypothetical protein